MKETIKAIIEKIETLSLDRCIVAIDGRCASGKTTLAEELGSMLDCSVIHMDDFFLQPNQRTEMRLNEAGGNIDYERFLYEVINPIQRNANFSYRPFDCYSLGFKEAKEISVTNAVIIEGAYACHPKFADIYDLKVFLDVDKNEQLKRIEKRNGKNQLSAFENKWIPMEEKYFKEFSIKEMCDAVYKANF